MHCLPLRTKNTDIINATKKCRKTDLFDCRFPTFYRCLLHGDLQIADMDNQMPKALKRLRKVDLLIVDDFLLTSTNSTEQKYLMKIF